jgi:lysylphosphatidylglycerol synthetase-like protein (DUF2156 family)
VTEEVPLALACWEGQQLQVAAETWLPLGELAFTGRRWQDVRTAVNRAGREGVVAHWTTWSQAPRALREQIELLSEEWLAAEGLPEMGFTWVAWTSSPTTPSAASSRWTATNAGAG